MVYELVPPGCHHRNAAKVAICIFKAHFLSILAGVSKDFPMNLWDRLLPQAEITVNLLRQSNATPTVSAYAHLNGPFDYNKMPLAPLGCRVQVHEKTDSRGTWAFHSIDGWYLGTSPEHYRTHKCHIITTNSDRLSDTVSFQHKHITNPSPTPANKLMQAIADCRAALTGITSPSRDINQLHALLKSAVISNLHSPSEHPNNALTVKPDITRAAPRVPPSPHTPILWLTGPTDAFTRIT